MFQLAGLDKLIGILPLAYGSSLFVFYILVAAFLMDQKHKLSGVAQRPLPGLPSISSVVSLERFWKKLIGVTLDEEQSDQQFV